MSVPWTHGFVQGKRVVQAAAAKRHTVVLTVDGEVFSWGHRGVSPRLVRLAGTRDVLSASGEQLWFHRGHQDVFRPQVGWGLYGGVALSTPQSELAWGVAAQCGDGSSDAAPAGL